jgi:hypothetical protein
VSSVVKSMNVRALEPIRALHDHDGRQSAVASIRTPRRRFRYSTERRSRTIAAHLPGSGASIPECRSEPEALSRTLYRAAA